MFGSAILRRSTRVLFAAASAALLTAACFTAASAQGRNVTIRFASYLPEAAPQSKAVKWWADEVKKESNGRINVRLFFASSLVPVTDGLPAVGQGRADMALVVTFQHSRELPMTTISELPFVSSNPVAAQVALKEMYDTFPPFTEEFNRSNVRLMWSPPTGVSIIGSNKPVNDIRDLQGLRIRGGAKLLSEALRAAGGNVISITSPELYESMKRGVVDAWGSSLLESMPSFGWHEVTKYVVDPGSGLFAMALHVINKDFFDKLSPEDQQLLTRVGEKAANVAVEEHIKEDAAACDKLAALKTRVTVWPAAATDEWKSKLPDFTKEWIDDQTKAGRPGKEMADRYLAALRKAEASSDYVPGVRNCAARLAN